MIDISVSISSFENSVVQGNYSFGENIKILLLQQDEDIFSKLPFDIEEIYTDPLFFAIFNNYNKNKYLTQKELTCQLNALIFGYSNNETKNNRTIVSSDEYGRFYIPKEGWFSGINPNSFFHIYKEDEKYIHLEDSNGHTVDFFHEPCLFIEGTQIELMKYSHPLLRQYFSSDFYNDVDFVECVNKHMNNIKIALSNIKNTTPSVYSLIEKVLNRIVLFDIDSKCTNSFMSRSAYGAAFLNTYQEDYNEVFFIEDLTHQVGHVIFEALVYEREEYFNGDYNIILESNKYEDRTIEIGFHSLFTYLLILTSLDASLQLELYRGKKLHEIKGRLLYTLTKCGNDLNLINEEKANKYFTEKGLKIYYVILKTYHEIRDRRFYLFEKHTIKNQPYNFTYSVFDKMNPILVNK